MANPPVNRRLGSDVRIVQADSVRGYDSPLAANPPCDLVISPGLNTANSAVSEIFFWNRSDLNDSSSFIIAVGSDFNTSTQFQVLAGQLADPTGTLTTQPFGSLYLTNNPPGLWQRQNDGSWKKISDDLGGETLEETLAIGNVTGDNNIIMSIDNNGPLTAAAILGEDTSDGSDAGDLLLQAGSSSAAIGDGGDVVISSGGSVGGNSGSFTLGSLDISGGGNSGFLFLRTGDVVTGTSGNAVLSTGSGDNVGPLDIVTGTANVGLGGALRLLSGGGAGGGGPITVLAGSGLAGDSAGGTVSITAGAASGIAGGGQVQIIGGSGGPGGGVGGDILLTPGFGGGGADDGQVTANGVFTASNYLRGTSDPNVAAIPGEEGYLFQRSLGGMGEVYVNTNGSQTGWKKLAFAADFINSFSRIQYGTITPALNNLGGIQEDISDFGLCKGARIVLNATGSEQRLVDDVGPYNELATTNQFDEAGIDIQINTSGVRRSHRFISTFKFQNEESVTGQRVVAGFSTADLSTMLGSDSPGGEYMILQKRDLQPTWSFTVRGPGGDFVQSSINLAAYTGQTLYAVFDMTDTTVVRFSVLDENFDVLDEKTVEGANLIFAPALTTNIYPVFGVAKTALGLDTPTLRFYVTTVVSEADLILSAGGSLSNPTLQQVLQAGNETGGNDILLTHGDRLVGEEDGNAPDGGNITFTTGGVTGAGDTGDLLGFTASNGVVGTAGGSGDMEFGTGEVFSGTATGDTGRIQFFTGNNNGEGNTGPIIIRSGNVFPPIGNTATTGDVTITTGQGEGDIGTLFLLSGDTLKTTGDGGDIEIRSGSALNPSTGAGGDIRIITGTPSPIGNSDAGALQITTPAGSGTGDGGDVTLTTGVGGGSGNGGDTTITLGDGNTGGSFFVTAGDSITSPAGGTISLIAGNATAVGSTGGRITLTPGSGVAGDGDVLVNGKLTVTGLIDPTGLVLDAQAVAPFTPVLDKGVIWQDSGTQTLFFTNINGTFDLQAGGGSSTLAGLTDVNLGVLANGDVLTYNLVSGFWENVPGGGGGAPLSTVLGLGNTTGGSNIQISIGDRIEGASDVDITPLAGDVNLNGDTVVNGKLTVTGLIDPTGLVLTAQGAQPVVPGGNDGLIWVNNTGEFVLESSAGTVNVNQQGTITGLSDTNVVGPSNGEVLVYQGGIWVNQNIGGGASSLQATLTVGNTTGGNNIELTNNDSLVGATDGVIQIIGGINDGGPPNILGFDPGDVVVAGGPQGLGTTSGKVLIFAQDGASGTTGSASGRIRIRVNNGGSGTTGNGGNGGLIEVSCGDGGDTDTATAGNASPFTVTGGAGGTANAAGGTPGNGSTITLQSGNGGPCVDQTGGSGGAILLQTGNGATGNTGGNGGNIDILAGDGSTGAPASGNGGDVTIQSGDYGDISGFKGVINVLGTGATGIISSVNPGDVYIQAALSPNGTGNAASLLLGAGVPGAALDAGGSLILEGGTTSAIGRNGGSVDIRGGIANDPTGEGGPVRICGGPVANPYPSFGGIPTPGRAGGINLEGGQSTGTAKGGGIRLDGGTGGPSSTAGGGDIQIIGGGAFAGSNGNGGNITIQPGAADGAGTPGEIILGRLQRDGVGMKFGSVTQSAVSVAYTYGVGPLAGYTAFSAAPTIILLTMGANAVDIPGGTRAHITPGTLTATGFTLELSPAPLVAITVYWEVKL